jgi:hypothetical protein
MDRRGILRLGCGSESAGLQRGRGRGPRAAARWGNTQAVTHARAVASIEVQFQGEKTVTVRPAAPAARVMSAGESQFTHRDGRVWVGLSLRLRPGQWLASDSEAQAH